MSRSDKGGRAVYGWPPWKMGRKASLEEGEQTEEANHPGDGSPERLCGPVVQSSHGTGKAYSRKPQARAFPVRSYDSDRHSLSLRTNDRRVCALCLQYPRSFSVKMAFRYHSRSAPGDRKIGQENHPLDGSLSLLVHLSGGTLRVPFSRGPAVHGPSPHGGRPPLSLRDIPPTQWGDFPFVAARHFPHSVGESSRAPAESPLPAPVGTLFVRHWRTAPFEKAGETFMFCSLVA